MLAAMLANLDLFCLFDNQAYATVIMEIHHPMFVAIETFSDEHAHLPRKFQSKFKKKKKKHKNNFIED